MRKTKVMKDFKIRTKTGKQTEKNKHVTKRDQRAYKETHKD